MIRVTTPVNTLAKMATATMSRLIRTIAMPRLTLRTSPTIDAFTAKAMSAVIAMRWSVVNMNFQQTRARIW